MSLQKHNSHYEFNVQPIDLIRHYNLDFSLGNVIKYPYRYKKKNGLQDLEKTLVYFSWVCEDLYKNEPLINKEDSIYKDFISEDNDVDDKQRRFYDLLVDYLYEPTATNKLFVENAVLSMMDELR